MRVSATEPTSTPSTVNAAQNTTTSFALVNGATAAIGMANAAPAPITVARMPASLGIARRHCLLTAILTVMVLGIFHGRREIHLTDPVAVTMDTPAMSSTVTAAAKTESVGQTTSPAGKAGKFAPH